MKNLSIIQNKIHESRGLKVMLDFDLAELYQVETKALNQAVKRNSDRFPEDFMIKLTAKEWETMRSQIVTASGNSQDMNWSQFVTSSKKHRGKTYLPNAFTEHGVTMLASVLRSERAVKMNISIVRAFIALRQIALYHKDLAEKLDQLRTEMYERLGDPACVPSPKALAAGDRQAGMMRS